MSRQARALLELIESMDEPIQRELVRSLFERFEDLVGEEEDRVLAKLAAEEHEAFSRGEKITSHFRRGESCSSAWAGRGR